MTSTDPATMQALLDRPLDELLEELDLYDADPQGPRLSLGRHRRPRAPTPLRRMGLVRDSPGCALRERRVTWRWSSSACSPSTC